MKANELMIGDYVSVKPSGMLIKIAAVHPKKVAYHTVVHKLSWVRESLLEPILLTPEILEKNGWAKTKYGYGRDCMEIHGADELPEGADNALSMARWSVDKNYQYHFLDLYMWQGSVKQHNVHYVHQFQHAFRIFGIDKEEIVL